MYDDFIKEKKDIREKLLKYSRAIREGKSFEEAAKQALKDPNNKKALAKKLLLDKNPKKSFFNFFNIKKEEKKLRKINKRSNFESIKKSPSFAIDKLVKEGDLSSQLRKSLKKDKNDFFDIKDIELRKRSLKSFEALTKQVLINKEKEEKKIKRSLKDEKVKIKSSPFTIGSLFKKQIPKKLKQAHEKEKKPLKNQALKEPKRASKESEKMARVLNASLMSDAKIKIKSTKKQVFKNNHLQSSEKDQLLKGALRPVKRAKQEFKPKRALSLDDDLLLKDVLPKYEDLKPSTLLSVILTMFFTTSFFALVIYVRSNIYYESREIAELRAQERVLKQENEALKRALEGMRFQNQILDYLK